MVNERFWTLKTCLFFAPLETVPYPGNNLRPEPNKGSKKGWEFLVTLIDLLSLASDSDYCFVFVESSDLYDC